MVRDRHWVVGLVTVGSLPTDETSGTDPGRQHLVNLVSVEDDGATNDLSVIWEIEPGANVLEWRQPIIAAPRRDRAA